MLGSWLLRLVNLSYGLAMATPIEMNAKQVVRALAEFPTGCTCGDLLQKFREISNKKHATFYFALRYAKQQGWVVADGEIYVLDPAGSWKTPVPSIEQQLEHSKRENDRLEFVAESRLERVEALEDQLQSLRDWSNGGNGAAVENLLKILTDPGTTARQKLRATNVLLSYKTEPRVAAFVKGFLEDVVGDASILTDYRVEAAEQCASLKVCHES
jgi:hypothetical protein